MQARHGDLLLVSVGEMPDGAKQVGREAGRVVLAYGEATGHAHAIATPDVYQWDVAGQRYVQVEVEAADLTHEEHGVISLPRGVYQVIRQQGWDLNGEVRQVVD